MGFPIIKKVTPDLTCTIGKKKHTRRCNVIEEDAQLNRLFNALEFLDTLKSTLLMFHKVASCKSTLLEGVKTQQ